MSEPFEAVSDWVLWEADPEMKVNMQGTHVPGNSWEQRVWEGREGRRLAQRQKLRPSGAGETFSIVLCWGERPDV